MRRLLARILAVLVVLSAAGLAVIDLITELTQ